MIHASVELVEAMLGVAPAASSEQQSPNWSWPACGAPNGSIENALWATEGYASCPGSGAHEEKGTVDCPACLVAMDAALEGRAVGVKG